ncbi:DUF1488 domain-containing protein [Paraburkholderia sp. CNPSo 3272]|uniref:DUF1488 family protein n=1 Tax=Paraburkholderia sp. CNPSo 3272 TaxID=2940931 RepID=UPI0020B700FE|nr:DUF1488 family protein [Paraburkholderia sp. CNPSo 3272]MCP3725231.1 DUF1488 domain-containing protein [Paraburkholderia sp. CNPSo 3272]
MNSEPFPRIVAAGCGVEGNAIECVITREALEHYFWLGPRACEARLLKTFHDAYAPIRAMAERKLLAQHQTSLTLTVADFEHS